MKSSNKTYNVVFNDDLNSDQKGFAYTYREALHYINQYNGTNESYFADYKGGTVSIVCNETGETVLNKNVF